MKTPEAAFEDDSTTKSAEPDVSHMYIREVSTIGIYIQSSICFVDHYANVSLTFKLQLIKTPNPRAKRIHLKQRLLNQMKVR